MHQSTVDQQYEQHFDRLPIWDKGMGCAESTCPSQLLVTCFGRALTRTLACIRLVLSVTATHSLPASHPSYFGWEVTSAIKVGISRVYNLVRYGPQTRCAKIHSPLAAFTSLGEGGGFHLAARDF